MASLVQDRPPRDPAPGKKWERVPRVVNGLETYEWIEVDDASGPSWGTRAELRLLNHDLPRLDGPEKVSGRAAYPHDVRAPGMLYARFLCCHLPVARVTLDLGPARALEGVREVRALIEPEGQTRFLGQPVAVAAAATPELAEDAVHAIVASFEPLPFAVTPEQALAEGAVRVTQSGNVREDEAVGNEDETLIALDGCEAVVEASYSLPVQHHVCLETHGVVVDYRGGEQASVHASTQGTFSVLDDAPEPLGLARGNVVVLVPYMGGGFGSKFGLGREGRVACELSRDLECPIHFLLSREQEFLMAGNRSGARQRLRAGVAADGELLSLWAEVDRLGGLGRGSHARLPYVYAAQQSFLRMRSVHTNTDANRAFRAPGHAQASFAMESILDELAYAAGLDLLAIRKRNLPPSQREVYLRQLDRVAREIGWEEHPHKNRWDASDALLKTGIGFGVSTWGGGGGPECQVDVRIDREGGVTVTSGTQDLGTGTRTYVAAIVAEELGLPLEGVVARIGDSRYGRANGSGGSTTTASLAPAVKQAAFKARRLLFERVAQELGAPSERLAIEPGHVVDRSAGGKRIPWREACALLGQGGLEARGEWQQGLSGNGVHGAQAAKVTVDTLTGEVRVLKMVCIQDCGLPLNRLALRSQINGGMIQALSYGLLEERVIDPVLGYALNANLEDYKIAGCREIPELLAIVDEDDTRDVVIGLGEPPVICGHAAIANALQNACGVRLRDLPLTADKVLMGLEALRAGRSSARQS